VIAGASAGSVGGGATSAAVSPVTDEGAKVCARWLRLNSKIERLQARWAVLEAWLGKEHSWFQLTEAEQQILPWAREFRDIDGSLDALFEKRATLLSAMPATGSRNLEALATKLAVVERLIWPSDHPEAHALIVGAVQDLLVLSRSWTPRF